MADRQQLPAPRQQQHLPIPISSSQRTRLTSGGRRNIGTSHLNRRNQLQPTVTTGTAASISVSSASAIETTTTLSVPTGISINTAQMRNRTIDFEPTDVEIVARNVNGDIDVFDPSALLDDEGGAPDEREEARRERERLADNVKQLAMARGPGEDDEFLDALRASLRAKVASLNEDGWMYESQTSPIIQ